MKNLMTEFEFDIVVENSRITNKMQTAAKMVLIE